MPESPARYTTQPITPRTRLDKAAKSVHESLTVVYTIAHAVVHSIATGEETVVHETYTQLFGGTTDQAKEIIMGIIESNGNRWLGLMKSYNWVELTSRATSALHDINPELTIAYYATLEMPKNPSARERLEFTKTHGASVDL